jgi:GDP/GTP exchange factor required for growth at low temperature
MSSLSTPSNFTDYNAEIEDLGIAVSPKSKNQQMKRISFTSGTGKRFSRSSSNSLFKRDSVKSYVSYDSAFSVSRESINETGNLRKKAGVNNLRTLAGLPAERKSFESTRIYSTSSVRKSIRTSTVLALSELPFNGYYESKSSVNLGGNKVYRNSGIGDSSVFSVAMKSRTSVANSFQTLNESADQTNDSDEFAFGFRAPSEDNDSLKHSIAIPGISNNVLKELAAIPDESFHFNPIDFALNKLEGVKKEHHIYNDELNTSETTHVDDTQDILNEINNANTEDIIETSSQNYTEDRPMTPLKQLDQEVNTSTPTQQNILNNTVGTLESQDDANIDNVFIFSANYSNGTEVIRSHGQSQSDSPVYQSPRLILQNYNLHDGLGIESTMSNDKHISFILSYSSTELTDHFTLIERDILQEIDWKDLIELKWNKELTPVNSWLEIIVNDDYFNSNRGVNLVIARFNLMVNWIISEILLTKNLHEQVQIFSRFIHIANNCLANQNYSTLMQILLALTSEKISKLKQTWKELPPGDILILKNLEELSSPIKNFLNLRVSINKIQPSRGCVPFVGLYLSDLIFNTERPKFINKTKGLVNFARFRTSVHIVKSLSQCIEWSSYYNLTVNNELLSKCLYIRSLNEDEMNFCLSKIIDP